jgi:hypothetical protein
MVRLFMPMNYLYSWMSLDLGMCMCIYGMRQRLTESLCEVTSRDCRVDIADSETSPSIVLEY